MEHIRIADSEVLRVAGKSPWRRWIQRYHSKDCLQSLRRVWFNEKYISLKLTSPIGDVDPGDRISSSLEGSEMTRDSRVFVIRIWLTVDTALEVHMSLNSHLIRLTPLIHWNCGFIVKWSVQSSVEHDHQFPHGTSEWHQNLVRITPRHPKSWLLLTSFSAEI